jgi:hypothetical protein
MNTTRRIALFLLAFAATPLPSTAWAEERASDASEQISRIIYSDLSKADMLDRLAPFVRIGDKLVDVPARTGTELGLCLESGPGVVDCRSLDGLQLVADPEGRVQIIRRAARTIEGKAFPEMSISTGVMRWKGYARGYPD